MGVNNLGLVTPHNPNVTRLIQKRFEAANIKINMIGSFYWENDQFVGCIDLNSILEEAENVKCKLITSSNHALAWHLLRLAGVNDEFNGFGILLKLKHV